MEPWLSSRGNVMLAFYVHLVSIFMPYKDTFFVGDTINTIEALVLRLTNIYLVTFLIGHMYMSDMWFGVTPRTNSKETKF